MMNERILDLLGEEKFQKIQNCRQELDKVKNFWKMLLRKIASIYTIRIHQYYAKWMDCISNH